MALGYSTTTSRCGVCFEGPPIWLGAIRLLLVDWSRIYVSKDDEVRLRTQHRSTWTFVQKKVAIVSNEDMVGLRDVDLWFVSGTMIFKDSLTILSRTKSTV